MSNYSFNKSKIWSLRVMVVFCCVCLKGYAQTDTVFWFAPPDLEINHQQTPIRFCVTTYDEPATVTFSQPANSSFTPVTFNIPANNFHVYDVSSLVDVMETKPINTVVSRGMYITSTTPVSCYYESVGNNSEIYTLKGENALGTDFIVPTQIQYSNNYSSSTSSIEIIATEDNTVVQITAPVALRGGIPANSTVTVTLQRGQSYAVRADGTAASAHLHNTVIHSNKPIAVNSTDDSVYAPGGCFDLIGDQLVPVPMVGTHYVALRNSSSFEYLFIFPIENQTTVSINGVTQSMLDIGQSINYALSSSTTAYNVESDKPVVVFQMTAIGCELGGTMLPQIECTGSNKVTHLRPNSSMSVVTIVVNTDYVYDFKLNGNPNAITAADFMAVPNSSNLSYCVKNISNYVSVGSVMTLQNDSARFHLGILDGSPGGDCSYGFFSDYARSSYINFDMDSIVCLGDNLVFGYTAPNVDHIVLTGPGNLNLTSPPFVLPVTDTAQTGWYYMTGTDSASCLNVLGDSLYITVMIPSDTQFVEAVVCDSLTWDGENTYYESGSYPVLYSTSSGCDSLVVLNLTVLHSTTGIDTLTACDSLTWINGITYHENTDTATYVLPNAAGCDSVVTLHLTVNHSTSAMVDTAVVQNALPYHYNDSAYVETGTYTQNFTNSLGCDSILTIHIEVYQNVTNQVDTTVCAANLPYTWGGHVFAAAGTFVDTLLTSHGADSVVTYTLTVDEIAVTIPNVTHVTCFGGSNGAATAMVTGGMPNFAYAWTDVAGASVSTTTSISNQPAGTYTFTVTDVIGCVATATVTLNTLNDALQPGTITENQMMCEGEQPLPFTGTAASGGDNGAYQWQISANGTDWTPAPGTNNTQGYIYPDPVANDFSLRRAWISQSCGIAFSNTVTVSVWSNTSDTITAEVCQGETYQQNGFDIMADQTAEPGEYTFEQHYATGYCDSAVLLFLTVHSSFETVLEDKVCEGDGYSANGFNITPLETVGVEVLDRILTMQSIQGCDSMVSLHLTIIDTALSIVSLTPDFCEEMSAELMVVTGMPNYVWNTGETTPNITVISPGYYAVTSMQGDCRNTAHIQVEGCHFDLYLPNAITPSNSDGLNDCFCIPEQNQRNMALFEIAVFNRWGEMVYYSTDKNFKWNGECRGEIKYQTIYNYVIKYTDTSGRPFRRTGSITVL